MVGGLEEGGLLQGQGEGEGQQKEHWMTDSRKWYFESVGVVYGGLHIYTWLGGAGEKVGGGGRKGCCIGRLIVELPDSDTSTSVDSWLWWDTLRPMWAGCGDWEIKHWVYYHDKILSIHIHHVTYYVLHTVCNRDHRRALKGHKLSATSFTCIRYLTYFAVVIDGRRELARGIGGGASLGGAGSFLPCTSIVSVPSRTSASRDKCTHTIVIHVITMSTSCMSTYTAVLTSISLLGQDDLQ